MDGIRNEVRKIIKEFITSDEVSLLRYFSMSDEEFKVEVDVINPRLAKILQNKYGFYVVGQLSQDRVLMSV